MNNNDTRSKLENIIRGTIIEGETDYCTTIRNHLCSSFSTSTTVKKDFESKSVIKEEQAQFLRLYSSQNSLWITELPKENTFLARGGEATIYFNSNNRSVIKVNDAIYYATWLEY
jgi:aspartate oxidase